jgi:hypothetical protein
VEHKEVHTQQGNVADTQIEQDYGREASECKLGGNKPEDNANGLKGMPADTRLRG